MTIFLAIFLLLVIPMWRICQRTGTHPATIILLAIPVAGFFLWCALISYRQWDAEASHGGLR